MGVVWVLCGCGEPGWRSRSRGPTKASCRQKPAPTAAAQYLPMKRSKTKRCFGACASSHGWLLSEKLGCCKPASAHKGTDRVSQCEASAKRGM